MTTFIFLSVLTLTGNQVLLGLLGVAALLALVVVAVKFYWQHQHTAHQEDAKERSMRTKKYSVVDIRQHSTNIKLLSLVSAIGVVVIIFAWTHHIHENDLNNNGLVLEGLNEVVPVTSHELPPKLPALPPPPVENRLIQEVDYKPVMKPESPMEIFSKEPTTGSHDGTTTYSLGDIEIEPEPIPTEPVPIDLPPLIGAEQMPRFPGCEGIEGEHVVKKQCADQKMLSFIYDNIQYPQQALEGGIEGMVVVSFVVDKQGKLQNIKLLRDPGGGLGEEALRIVRRMNALPEAWTPGKQRGKTVKVQYNLPVRFKLDN